MVDLLQRDFILQTKQRSNAIDALRGLAALAIVIYHARPMFWVGLRQIWNSYGLSLEPNAVLGYLSTPFSFGGFAVDLFFVLSGYCIHRKGAYLLAQDKNNKINLKKYLFRRFIRIYPVYISALLLTAVVHLYVSRISPNLIIDQDNSWFSFLTSLFSLQGLLAPSFAHNSVFWTLSIEIHFYIIYPLIYFLLSKVSGKTMLAIFASISFSYILVNENFDFLVNLFAHKGSGGPLFIPYLFTWGVGIYLAEIEADRASFVSDFKLGFKEACFFPNLCYLIAFVIIFYLSTNAFIILITSVFFGCLVYWSRRPSGEAFWLGWSGKFFSFLGLFSYSLYATHRPILLLMKTWIDPLNNRFFSLSWTFISTSICILFAYIFFSLIEKKFLNNSQKYSLFRKR